MVVNVEKNGVTELLNPHSGHAQQYCRHQRPFKSLAYGTQLTSYMMTPRLHQSQSMS
jgi:hypothetical protein